MSDRALLHVGLDLEAYDHLREDLKGGGQRPLGVPTLEDKIVQGTVAELLSAVYEVDFIGFSYGFRPGRNPHMALSALHTALMSQRVNWVCSEQWHRLVEWGRLGEIGDLCV